MDPKDLFSNLSPDSLPELASVAELLSAIAKELGEDFRNKLEEMLGGRELPDRMNVRELLGEFQEELGEPYFDRFLNAPAQDAGPSRRPGDDNDDGKLKTKTNKELEEHANAQTKTQEFATTVILEAARDGRSIRSTPQFGARKDRHYGDLFS